MEANVCTVKNLKRPVYNEITENEEKFKQH